MVKGLGEYIPIRPVYHKGGVIQVLKRQIVANLIRLTVRARSRSDYERQIKSVLFQNNLQW